MEVYTTLFLMLYFIAGLWTLYRQTNEGFIIYGGIVTAWSSFGLLMVFLNHFRDIPYISLITNIIVNLLIFHKGY